MNVPLDPSSFPLSLYQKAKQLLWDPREIDLTQDVHDWARLDARERDILLRLAAQFLGGEQAVTHDLAPLLIALRRQGGRLEDEMFLTAQLFEESKHVEWFDRWFAEVAGGLPPALDGMASAPYRALFHEALPAALDRLLSDASPSAQVEAIATYHLSSKACWLRPATTAIRAPCATTASCPARCAASRWFSAMKPATSPTVCTRWAVCSKQRRPSGRRSLPGSTPCCHWRWGSWPRPSRPMATTSRSALTPPSSSLTLASSSTIACARWSALSIASQLELCVISL